MEKKALNTALLVMDMQAGILGNYDTANLLVNTAGAIANARNKNIPVIYVVLGLRAGLPEISLNNKGLAASKERMMAVDMQAFVKIENALAPLANDIVVTKKRYSAFTGSDLEVVLRSKEIGHLVLAGVSTSGVVLSTLREAADKDFRITVLSDCCMDLDEEVHRVLTTKVFMRQADVITKDDWCKQ